MAHVLLVEDDEDVAFAYLAVMRRAGHTADRAASLAEARALLARRVFDLVLVDLSLGDGSGMDVLKEVRSAESSAPVIVQTGVDRADAALQAIRAGASDYLVKPVLPELLAHAMDRALQNTRVAAACEAQLRSAERLSPGLALALGSELDAAARSQAPALILGESGTGKERVAHLLHELSPWSSGPFISFNAACASPNLVDAELFGHEAGAFTGAQKTRRGLFEMANGGTLFLDELGELPLEMQAKLLRVVEGQPFRRVGGEREITVRVRVVSATNRDLGSMVKAGRFREDLHHRLRMFRLQLPPLRDRPGDITVLASLFLARAARTLGNEKLAFSDAAWACLMSYPWPGNVRELAGVVERAAMLARERTTVDAMDLPPELRAHSGLPVTPTLGTLAAAQAIRRLDAGPGVRLEDVVRDHVLRTFRACGGNLSRAARELGISRPTLRAKLTAYATPTEDPELDTEGAADAGSPSR